MKVKFPLAVFLFLTQGFALAQSLIDSLQLLHDVKALSADSMQGRKSCTAGSQKAQRYILAAFKKNHLQAFNGDFRQVFSFSHRGESCSSAVNLIGYFPGVAPDCIVLSAHYDHLGVVDGKIFYGADDNASGVATLLAMMEYFRRRQPRHTIIFAIFDAEESGLQGAKAFVKNLPVDRHGMALNVNLDMVSRNDKNELYVAGCNYYPFLKPYLEKIAKTSPIKLRFGHDSVWNLAGNWTDASDHAPFHEIGIPFAYFGVEDHQDYHKPTDVFAKINPKFFVNAARIILEAVVAFDNNLAEIIKAKNERTNVSSGN
jgi:Zn-dependent M28 family amino/carboxypeptidase